VAERVFPRAAANADSANGVGEPLKKRVKLFLASRHDIETMVALSGLQRLTHVVTIWP
jgi:hypothetical protein